LFDWRTPFLIVTAMGAVALVGLIRFLPREIAYQPPAPFITQLGLLGTRRLTTMYLLTAIGFGGTGVSSPCSRSPANTWLRSATTSGASIRSEILQTGERSPPFTLALSNLCSSQEGSVRSKIEAAIGFVNETGHAASIRHLEDAAAILDGTAGTTVRLDVARTSQLRRLLCGITGTAPRSCEDARLTVLE
jgi:hypothetical protein